MLQDEGNSVETEMHVCKKASMNCLLLRMITHVCNNVLMNIPVKEDNEQMKAQIALLMQQAGLTK